MKNIRIVPTDKPSRLWLTKLGNLTRCHDIKPIKEALGNNVNIYITSDEEIKEGDWIIDLLRNEISKANSLSNEDFNLVLDNGSFSNINQCKKIILTTDQDLIKDGVQAIDDEFLNWFVKNPSCEEVQVNLIKDSEDHPEIEGGYREEWQYYKIIIPKEETQGYICPQTKVQCDDECCTSAEKCNLLPSTDVFSEPKMNKIKKETFEKAKDLNYWKNNAEEYYLKVPISVLRYITELEKQQERSYSEEEVLHILDTLWDRLDIWYNKGMECDETEFNLKKWFNECELKKK